MSAGENRSAEQLEVKNPFPGLRPFEVDESELFFGREDEIQELLSRLRRTHFLAVVGSSGCGKSSVVRAGLVASLQDGFMAEPTARWRIAIMRPGNNPVAQLALALNSKGALGCACDDPAESAAMRQAALRRGTLGIVEAYEEAGIASGSKLLLLVDQFEELFRFMRESTGASERPKDKQDGIDQAVSGLRRASLSDEAQAFVKLLLVAAHSNLPIYVVLTMRSEFLGHCANFPGLPEAINRGLYLLPQMSRDQSRDAIEGPIEVSGGQIAPRLVNRLLNDLSDADQLPILQHAIMRMWSEWSPNRQGGPIDLEHYKNIGELRGSLSAHAEETYESLTESQQEIAELLFRTITETTEDQQTVRRPAEFSVVCEIVRHARKQDAPSVEEPSTVEREVMSVVNKFREEGRSFLMPSADRSLEPHTIIDISHESLIRQWDRLREWAEKEARFTKIRRRLKGAAEEWQEKNWTDATLLYTGARLLEAEEYAKDRGTTLTPLEKDFIEASDAQREAERTRKLEEAKREAKSRFQRRMVFVLIIALLASSAAVVFFSKARKAQRDAEEARKRAEHQSRSVQQADVILASLASFEGVKERKEIEVDYRIKDQDDADIQSALKGLGFSAERIRGTRGDIPANKISYQPNVEEVNVKLVAYAFIRTGAQIKTIEPSDNASQQTLTIEIYGDSANLDKPTLTVEQIRDMRLNFAFPVIGSFRNKDKAFGWARKVEAATTEYKPQIYFSTNGLYAVTLGGYLTQAEAQKRIDFAKARGDLSTDTPFVKVSKTWGDNLLNNLSEEQANSSKTP